MTFLNMISRLATSRVTKLIVFGAWLLSLLWMISKGWVWESREVLSNGNILERKNYWNITRTPIFLWLTLLVLGYVVSAFKKWSIGYYGLFEILLGVIGGFLAVSALPLTQLEAWLVLLASAFAIVQGVDNVASGRERSLSGNRALSRETTQIAKITD